MDVKYCKDCAHVRRVSSGYEYARCAISQGDLIEGGLGYCSVERSFPHLCGKVAKNFEQKTQPDPVPVPRPWWAFWRAA